MKITIQLVLIEDEKKPTQIHVYSCHPPAIPAINEAIHLPKITQDKTNEEYTVCWVTQKRHIIPKEKTVDPYISIGVSLKPPSKNT
jgi:hypothetical protein